MSSHYLLQRAVVEHEMRRNVLASVRDGRFTQVLIDPPPEAIPADVVRRAGVAVAGLANCHSHAFHRLLRGRTQNQSGSFWSWREQMYATAQRLTPQLYCRLARGVFAEMLAAGFTSVGEFHYLHHPAQGRYENPNEMGLAVIAAAREVGVRITLLDTCYLAAGINQPTAGVQRRFDDGSVAGWAQRVADLRGQVRAVGDGADGVRVGVAAHSVRAVPRAVLPDVAQAARGAVVHLHLSEQPAENEQTMQAWGLTPTQVVAEAGLLSERTTVVHATHLRTGDIALLGEAGGYACFCPTTERDLADGVGPSRALAQAGVRLTVGSDSQAVIDAFEELRAVELNERLASGVRGAWTPEQLLHAGTVHGQQSLGFDDAGEIAVGQRADLVLVEDTSVRLAGTGDSVAALLFAASAADVVAVMADGVWHDTQQLRTDAARELQAVSDELFGQEA